MTKLLKATTRKLESGLTIRVLSPELTLDAELHARAESRSIGRQLEHWARVGKLGIQNPDLPFRVISDWLVGFEQARAGQLENYTLGKKK